MTTETVDAVLARVRKLLALAGDSAASEQEAANAAAAAQRLLTRHQIDVAMLDVEGDSSPEFINVDVRPVDTTKRTVAWRWTLSEGICKLNGCRSYWHGNRDVTTQAVSNELRIVGKPSRVTAVRYMYGYLAPEVERLGAAAALGKGRSYGHAWRMGCVNRLIERLNESARESAKAAKQEALGAGTSLARIESALARSADEGREVDHWNTKHMKLRSMSGSPLREPGGFDAGRAAAEKIRLGGHAALGAGNKRVGGG